MAKKIPTKAPKTTKASTASAASTSAASAAPGAPKAGKKSKSTAPEYILSQLPCFVHDLQLSTAKLFPATSGTTELKIAQTSGQPYYCGEFSDEVFQALLALCADAKISFKTISPSLLAMSLTDSKYKPKFPVVASPQDPTKTYFLPMAIEAGIVEGGGRFFAVGEDASTFVWNETKAKGGKKVVAAKAVGGKKVVAAMAAGGKTVVAKKTVVKKKSVKAAKVPKAKKVSKVAKK